MKTEINLSFKQILDLIRQLPLEKKVELSKVLEEEAIDSRLKELLTEFRTDKLSYDEISDEVEKVREDIYVKRKKN
jgi:hypothetical protein